MIARTGYSFPKKLPFGFAGPAASLIFHIFKVFWLAQKPVYDHGGHLIFVEEGTTKTKVVPLSLDLRTVFMWSLTSLIN